MSKSKGQVLRVAAVMHVLFHMETPAAIPQEISEEAIKAADLFVDFCIQHAAFLGGRGKVEDAIADIQGYKRNHAQYIIILITNLI